MNKRIGFITFIAIMSVLLITPSFAQDTSGSGEIEAGALHFPPFSNVKNHFEVDGYLIDLATQVLDKAGVTFDLRTYSPKKLYMNLATGKTDFFIGPKNVVYYEKETITSSFVVTQIDLRVYTMSKENPIKSPDDLKGQAIITRFGYNFGGFIKFLENPENNITVHATKKPENMFLMLGKKRANYFLNYQRPTETWAKEQNIQGLKSNSIQKIDLYFIVSKKAPDAQNLLTRLEKAFNELKADGANF